MGRFLCKIMSMKAYSPVCLVLLAILGCDALYTTRQVITVQVKDRHTAESLADVRVDAGAKYYAGWGADMPEPERNDAWMLHHTQGSGTTGPRGRTSFNLEIQTVCGGLRPGVFPGFDARKDRVTGVPYLFRLVKDNSRETLRGTVEPGAIMTG